MEPATPTTPRAAPSATPPSGLARGTRRSADDSSQTRSRLLAATLATIYEDGYYRASSNAIARRAGMSWGVIQYYFGTREALLASAVEDHISETIERLSAVRVVGDTVEERLHGFTDALYEIYSEPRYLSVVEILWNLSREGTTAPSTRAALLHYVERENDLAARLLGEVAPVLGASSELRQLVLFACGGFSLSMHINEALYGGIDVPERQAPRDRQFQLLVRALASLVDDSRPADGR